MMAHRSVEGLAEVRQTTTPLRGAIEQGRVRGGRAVQNK